MPSGLFISSFSTTSKCLTLFCIIMSASTPIGDRASVVTNGEDIVHIQRLLEDGVKNYWKLKAIDSLGLGNNTIMPKEERNKIIDRMISNQQIQEMLLSNLTIT